MRDIYRDGFAVTDYSKLCAKHFTPDQFKIHPALAKKCGYKKLDLRLDAIPTLFDIHVPVNPRKTRVPQQLQYFKRRAISRYVVNKTRTISHINYYIRCRTNIR